MPATVPNQKTEPLKEDYTGWYVTHALRRLLLKLNAAMGTKCTDAELNIIAYLIYKGMAECRSKDWFLKDLRRVFEDENYEPRYGWVSTSANQLSDPGRAGVVFCSESKAGELLNKLIAMGILDRVEDPVHKRYFFYRVDYIFIAEAMRDAGESFLLPRVYDEENVNLSALLSAWEQEQEQAEEMAQAELVEDANEEIDTNTKTASADEQTGPSEEPGDAVDDPPEPVDNEAASASGDDDPLSAVQDELEAALVEVAPVVDRPCSTTVDSDLWEGSPACGNNIDLKDCKNSNITQQTTIETPASVLHSNFHPIVELSERFHEVFYYVPGRKAGIKAAIRDLCEKGYPAEDFDAAFKYSRWTLKQPGSIKNPVGWFKTCVMRRFWETDNEYQDRTPSLKDRDNDDESDLPWEQDDEKISAEEMRKGIERVFREAGLERRGKANERG